MFLICGLGNPGKKYINTRHNVGFLLADLLIKNYNFSVLKKDKKKELYKGYIGKKECIILKPLSYINLSGETVRESLNYYKININRLYVFHDDLDLKTSKIKIKIGGSNAGHNGLLSIDNHVGINYNRIRFGIGHPGNKELVSKYVLKKFTKDEKQIVNYKLNKICKYFELIFNNNTLFLTKIAEEKI